MEFRILGPLEVTEGDRLVSLGGGRQRALLALLLLHANEVVANDRLIDELWGEAAPATAAKSVQVYVSQLRKALHNGDHRAEVLLTRAGGYVLRVDRDNVDVQCFESSLEAGRQALAGDDPDRAARRLREALALWRGPPLADFTYEAFAQREIARLEDLRLVALEDRIEADLALGRHAAVVGEIETLLAEHPLRERLRGQLMLALYRCDRQAEALEAHRDGRRLLVEQLGLEPSPTLQRLERSILAQDPALAAPATARPARRSRPTERARRHRAAIAAVGAAILLAAGAAAVVRLIDASGSEPTRTIVGPLRFNAVAAIRPSDRTIAATAQVPGRLGRLAVGEGSVWVGSDDSHTVSGVDPRTHRVTRTLVPGLFPTDLAAGAGAVWVIDGHRRVLAKIRPPYGRVVDRLRLPGRAASSLPPADRFGTDPTSVAVGAGRVWVTDGTESLLRVDPHTNKMTAFDTGDPLNDVAVGAGVVWAVSGPARSALRFDPRSNIVTDAIPVARAGSGAPYPIAVAVAGDAVWVLNADTATVTKIDARSRQVVSTARVGADHGPTAIAADREAAWVANADGSLMRIDARTGKEEFRHVGWGLRDVGVGAGAVWVTNQLTRCCGQE